MQQSLNKDGDYVEIYGMTKATFENKLNIGIAQSILGMTKPWEQIREALFMKIRKHEDALTSQTSRK